jgi:Ca2+-binding RTX toxin-like protein
MYGGTEDDYFICDSSSDQVIENANEGLDWIYTTATFVMSDNVDYLLMQGSGAIAALGNNLSNSIVGNGADNVIDGGAGYDSMIGGAGNDAFVFARGQAHGDIVQDFAGNGAAAGDRIVFSGYGAGAAFGQLNATQWIVISGDGLTSEIINFINAAPIHSSDFMFV